MKRYHLWIDTDGIAPHIAEDINADGRWVKYDDARAALDSLFYAGEDLMLALCKELELEYTTSGKGEVIEAIKKLKAQD